MVRRPNLPECFRQLWERTQFPLNGAARMKHSSRIALAYLVVAAAWFGCSDSILAWMFPGEFLNLVVYNGLAFAAGTALLLKLWLGAEEARRDVIEAQLQKSAVTDPLTGLRNRAAFIDHLSHAVDRARREADRFGLLFLDIDDFKGVNDTFGHAAGDEVLRELGRRLHDVLRASEVPARLGGDEFVVLVDSGNDLHSLADRVMEVLREPYPIADLAMPITVSIGIAEFPAHGRSADALINAADSAMYRAKRAGRDRSSLAAAV